MSDTDQKEPDFFQIDLNRLEIEWCRQPRLVLDACLKLADLRQEQDRTKAEVDLQEAELSLDIRKNPSNYGLDKVTEATIASMVVALPSYQLAQRLHRKARHAVDVQQAYVNALDHKKKALESAVQLQLAGYFAAPREPKTADNDDFRQRQRDAAFSRGKKK